MARVIVVGAGVIGLSCAVRLLEHGHRVDVLARDLPLETTSAVAAALWYPYRAYPFERVTAWSSGTFTELERLSHDDATGVRMLKGTELHRAATADPWWVSAVPTLTRVSTMPAPYVDGWTFAAPVAEMPVYLRWLANRVEDLGGTLTRMALGALPDGNGAEAVVDATGLGARRMAADPTLLPIRGQVVLVEQVGLDRWWLDSAGPVYVVPRSRDIVVGGTDDEGEWDRRPDPDVAKQILERATELVPELAGARVLGHRVGLRPARPTVRLEEERRGTTRVVHCYGHGGAGVTLSWGCADEVAALLSA
ncbi:MAG TPA: FAD-dependent oxidoreductase [Nocardioides sp.]|uniref:FAD-dependent oxidoreductase n=1 Tax=Nocardioides sp. TaxID=35761 RepID=UPI002D80F855|nr:FAD-dependent oxidoreductase [Nocardioides sp.]HET6654251.1 FAD-dependent oxidoreductase [Nocardioides sp.]